MKRKILITGAASGLGRMLRQLLSLQPETTVLALDRNQLDILDGAQVKEVMAAERPSVIVNCAGFNQLAAAENEAAGRLSVNTRGIFNLAQAAAEYHAYLCTFSSKMVFDGKKGAPYIEDDDYWPLNQYGSSLQGGEEMLSNMYKNHLIIRSDLLYGLGSGDLLGAALAELGAGREVKAADDFFLAPTYLGDLAAAAVALISEWAVGVYHYTNEAGDQGVSYYDFLQTAAGLAGLDAGGLQGCSWKKIDWGVDLVLPGRAILDLSRFRETFPALVRPWQAALEDYQASRQGAE